MLPCIELDNTSYIPASTLHTQPNTSRAWIAAGRIRDGSGPKSILFDIDTIT